MALYVSECPLCGQKYSHPDVSCIWCPSCGVETDYSGFDLEHYQSEAALNSAYYEPLSDYDEFSSIQDLLDKYVCKQKTLQPSNTQHGVHYARQIFWLVSKIEYTCSFCGHRQSVPHKTIIYRTQYMKKQEGVLAYLSALKREGYVNVKFTKYGAHDLFRTVCNKCGKHPLWIREATMKQQNRALDVFAHLAHFLTCIVILVHHKYSAALLVDVVRINVSYIAILLINNLVLHLRHLRAKKLPPEELPRFYLALKGSKMYKPENESVAPVQTSDGFRCPRCGNKVSEKTTCARCGVYIDASLASTDGVPPSIIFVPAQTDREVPPHQLPGESAEKRGDHPVRIEINDAAKTPDKKDSPIEVTPVNGKIRCPRCGLEQNSTRPVCARCRAKFFTVKSVN